jgi:hypothetical protein
MPSKDWCQGFCRSCGTGCGQYCEEIHGLKNDIQCYATSRQYWIERADKQDAIIAVYERALERLRGDYVHNVNGYCGYPADEALAQAERIRSNERTEPGSGAV